MRNITVILRRLHFAVFVFTGVLFAVSCEEETDRPVGNNKIVISETTVDHVAYNWADLTGSIICKTTRFNRHDDHGFCWDTANFPDINRSVKSLGVMTELGTYSARIEGLKNNTRYYLSSYMVLNGGVIYGPVNEFSTTGCGTTMRIVHSAGEVAPVTKTVNYGTIETDITGSNKCWITQNLGADHQASSATDATDASAGWYWQFNQKQGFKHDGIIRTPNNTWITSINENSGWLSVNDPCSISLGKGWRLPTQTEWENVDLNEGWDYISHAYTSILKLHASGYMDINDGLLLNRGTNGYYWSNSQNRPESGWFLFFNNGRCGVYDYFKAVGYNVRCIRD